MIRRNKIVAAILAMGLGFSMIGITSNVAYAGEYSDISGQDGTRQVEQAKDSNGVNWYYYKYDDGTICIDGTYDLKSVMEIPAELNGSTVTGIDSLLGYENTIVYKESIIGKVVNKVIIPSGVKVIGRGAFARCANLAEIQIPESVKLIGEYAFNDKWLEANRNSDGFVVVNNILVDGHKASGNVTIPSNIKCIGDGAFGDYVNINGRFSYYKNIKGVTIPSSVKRIGKYAFFRCNLTKVTIAEGVEVIAEGAFSQCPNLTEIKIPQSVTELSNDAFLNDESIKIIRANSNGSSSGNSSNQGSQTNNEGTSDKVAPGWSFKDNNWYYGYSDGTKRTGWFYDNGNWYYFYGNGQMAVGFINLGGYYYYLDESGTSSIGIMKTGWQKIQGKWFYFNPNSDGYKGLMKRGCWADIDGNWYYFYSDGVMAANTYIDGYYVNSSGAWQ